MNLTPEIKQNLVVPKEWKGGQHEELVFFVEKIFFVILYIHINYSLLYQIKLREILADAYNITVWQVEFWIDIGNKVICKFTASFKFWALTKHVLISCQKLFK